MSKIILIYCGFLPYMPLNIASSVSDVMPFGHTELSDGTDRK